MSTWTHGLLGMVFFAAGLAAALSGYWSVRLRTERGWDARRRLHLLVLFLPVLLASLLFDDFIPDCPWWWTPLLFALAVLAGSCVHWLRQRHLSHLLSRYASRDEQTIRAEALLEPLARRLAIPPPPVRRVPGESPLALAVGSLQPMLYLSGYYLDGLSPKELGAVLAHELAHVARRDNLVAAWAVGLARIGFLIPKVREVRRAMLVERELAADELAAVLTGQPLVLAGVLLQLARSAPGEQPEPACAFNDPADLPRRIERLMALHRTPVPSAVALPANHEQLDWRSVCQWLVVIALAVTCIDWLPFWLGLP